MKFIKHSSIIFVLILAPFFVFSNAEIGIGNISFTVEGELKGFESGVDIWLGLIEPYELKGEAFKGKVENGRFYIKGTTFQSTLAILSFFLLDSSGKPKYQFPDAPKVTFYLCPGKNILNISEVFKLTDIKGGYTEEQKVFSSLMKNTAPYSEEINRNQSLQFEAINKSDTSTYFNLLRRNTELRQLAKPFYYDCIKQNSSSNIAISLLHAYNGSIFNREEAERLYNLLSEEVKMTTMGSEVLRTLDLIKNPAFKLIGTQVVDFELINEKGKLVKFSSKKGKYVFLDFWASWCSPCRKRHPELRKIYNEMGNEKIEFISISIDKDKTQWIETIRKDTLNWPQLLDKIDIDKTGWYGKVFTSFRGASVPLNFLIDPNGKIIECNISSKKLYEFLKMNKEVLK